MTESLNTLEDLLTPKELSLYGDIVKPFNIRVLRKALDRKLKEDPDYEVFVPFEYYRWESMLKRDVPSYIYLEGTLVSNKGRVYSTRGKRNKFLKVTVGGVGYKAVQMSIDNKNESFAMHRVLGCLFVPVEKPGIGFDLGKLQINHIDGVKSNIELSNLEWATGSANIYHALDTGLNKSRIPIIGEVVYGAFKGYRFGLPSARQAVPFGFSFKGVNAVCRGKRKHHKGVKWTYASNEDLTPLPNTIAKEALISLGPFIRKVA